MCLLFDKTRSADQSSHVSLIETSDSHRKQHFSNTVTTHVHIFLCILIIFAKKKSRTAMLQNHFHCVRAFVFQGLAPRHELSSITNVHDGFKQFIHIINNLSSWPTHVLRIMIVLVLNNNEMLKFLSSLNF